MKRDFGGEGRLVLGFGVVAGEKWGGAEALDVKALDVRTAGEGEEDLKDCRGGHRSG